MLNADARLVDVVLGVLPLFADNATHVCVVIPDEQSDYIGKWIESVRKVMADRKDPVTFSESEKFSIITMSSQMYAFSTVLGALVQSSVLRDIMPFAVVVDLVDALQGPPGLLPFVLCIWCTHTQIPKAKRTAHVYAQTHSSPVTLVNIPTHTPLPSTHAHTHAHAYTQTHTHTLTD